MPKYAHGDILNRRWPLPNVWLGVSTERQQEADERIPHLVRTPAAVRFLSVEPLLGPISFRWAKWDAWTKSDGSDRATVDHLDGLRMLDWVIVGGESGPNARPMHLEWAREIRDECAEAGVPFFFKQWGEFSPDERTRLTLHKQMIRVGKKVAGRLLDGVDHSAFPQVRA